MRLVWPRPDISLRNAVFLDRLLLELDRLDTFPVPIRVTGAALPSAARPKNAGLVYCSVHIPLFSLQLRGILEAGCPIPLVIAHHAAINANGQFPIPGSEHRLAAIAPGAKTMVRVRSELANGGVIGSMLDSFSGSELTPHLLQLAGKLNDSVVFVWSELGEDTPFPVCDTEAKVLANMAALRARRDLLLARVVSRAGLRRMAP